MKQRVRVLLLTLVFLSFLKILSVVALPVENVQLIPSGEYFDRVHSLLNGAVKSVLVVMYSFKYYTEYPLSHSNVFLQDLIKAKERGVNVGVLLDVSDFNDEITKENKRTGEILSRNGVKVYYDKIDITTHAKVLVIDSKYTIIGSHNWTYSGLSKNNEFSVLIDSEELAKKTEKYIMELIRGDK